MACVNSSNYLPKLIIENAGTSRRFFIHRIQSGFTMIELIAVMVILTILASTTIGSYSGFNQSLRLFEEVGLDAEMIRNLPPDMGWNPTQIYSFGRLVKSTHDEMFEAINLAPTIRPDRYTILNTTDLDRDNIHKLLSDTNCI